MSGFLPIVEELAAAASDRERAMWLLAAPPATLLTHQLEIRDVLAAAGFEAGRTGLAAEVAALFAVRDRHGYTPETIILSRNVGRADLAVIAYGGGEGDGVVA